MTSPHSFVLCSSLLLAMAGHAELAVAPAFLDNMVLQQGPHTMLSGEAAANHWIWVFYLPPHKSKPESRPLASAPVLEGGEWSVDLDLQDTKFAQPFGLVLRETEDKKGKKKTSRDLVLTNLVAADVWLLADQRDKGRPADKNDCYSDLNECGRVRFLDLATTQTSSDSPSPKSAVWEGYPTDHPDRFSALAMRLAPVLARYTNYVGVVLVTPASLQASLGQAPKPMENWNLYLSNRWKQVNIYLRQEQTNRWHQQLSAKRAGRVESIPPITAYDPPSVYWGAAHPSNSPPACRFTFVGAVWPRPD